jgi:hypothetical protein
MSAAMSGKALAWLERAKEKLSPGPEWCKESKERIIERTQEEPQDLDFWEMVKTEKDYAQQQSHVQGV